MKALRARHPWMSDQEAEVIRRAILARAAQQYESIEQWIDAAECWTMVGKHEAAAPLYARGGDLWRAAQTALDGEQFGQALTHYEAWTAAQVATDEVAQIKGLLGQAACHLLPLEMEITVPELSAAVGQALYQEARARLVNATPTLIQARAWAALGAYGHRVWRYDLIHEGYEQALRSYEAAGAIAERNSTAQTYLETVQGWGDRLLSDELEMRLAEWMPHEDMSAWEEERRQIENYPFRDGIRDVLHFTNQAQWAAWERLAEIEETTEVDDYLRSLTPTEMIYIPPGNFLMGSADDDPEARDNEKPQHELWLRGYYIDKYPVTNEQYAQFMAAGGYDKETYWTETGWAQKEKENWQQPRQWDNERYQGEGKPIVGVSWYEAMAYSQWAGKALPAEAQWEKAASWDAESKTKRRYPWGNEWDVDKGNFGRKHNTTTEVGDYPADSSAYGMGDVMGNVDEWGSTRWRNEEESVYGYPYDIEDGREDVSGGDNVWRSIRGASWSGREPNAQNWSRCGFRNWVDPWLRYNFRGFRCVLPHVCATPAAEF